MRALGLLLTAVRRIMTRTVGREDPNRRGRSYAVTVVTPINPGRTEALRKVLQAFGTGDASPLAKLPDVHFARWVVIDQLRTDWPGAPKAPPRLRCQYLLFSADVTVPTHRADAVPDAFFRDLARHMPDESAKVWGECWGYPGVTDIGAFVNYLMISQIESGLYYAAYEDATVADIRHALLVRTELTEFAREHQSATPPETLKARYLAASASW